MSELRADTITGSDGTSPVTLTKQAAAKAWATHTQSASFTLHDSLNVSSLTDDGTGKTFYNWTSNFGNAYFSATAGMGEFGGTFRNTPALGIPGNSGKTTALIKWESQSTGNSGTDSAHNNLTVHGDLA